jgi:alkylhydroperoxidase family enzyme
VAVPEEAFESAWEAGYTDEQITEMIANVALTTFSDYINEAVGTEVVLPHGQPVHSR